MRLFYFSFDQGKWFFKALPIKKKKIVSERPQLNAIDKIEQENKKVFDNSLANAAKDIVRYLV